MDLRQRLARVASSVPAALQITVAATIAYAIAHFVLGHAIPIVAVTVTITSLGFTRDARPRRVLETVIGILVGIALSELIIMLIGTGVWQLALVLTVTLLTARFVSASGAFAVAAGTQSMLVVLLAEPDGGVFVRSLDGLVGGALALLVTALIPRDPGVPQPGTDVPSSPPSTSRSAPSSQRSRAPMSLPPTSRSPGCRRSQQLVDDWTLSLDSASAIARLSPFLRRHRQELARQARLLTGLDLAVRHLRVISRRVDFLVRDGQPRPVLAEAVARGRCGHPGAAERRPCGAGASSSRSPGASDRALLGPESAMTESVVMLLLRPLVVDLLVAAGSSAGDARALLPET